MLKLQRVLGHATLAMTQKYVHSSPGHMAEVVLLNPLASIFEREGMWKSMESDRPKMELDESWTEAIFRQFCEGWFSKPQKPQSPALRGFEIWWHQESNDLISY